MSKEDISQWIKPVNHTIEYYGVKGAVQQSEFNSYAKKEVIEDNTVYSVKVYGGDVLDPYNIDKNRVNSELAKFVKVSKNTFDRYVDYLKRLNRSDFLNVSRDVLKERSK